MSVQESATSKNIGQPQEMDGKVNENERTNWLEVDWPWDEAAREPREWMK